MLSMIREEERLSLPSISGSLSLPGMDFARQMKARLLLSPLVPRYQGCQSWRWQAAATVAIGFLCMAPSGCASFASRAQAERQAVIDHIVASSAKVFVEQNGRRLNSGSGVVVTSRVEGANAEPVSYVLTAQHILDGKTEASLFVRFTGPYAVRGKLAGTLVRQGKVEGLDLALLRVPGLEVPAATLPDDDQIHLGEEILVVGFPWGKRLGIFSGIVSQVPADGRDAGGLDEGMDQTVVVDAASAMGVSGGGVFREAGGVLLGIVEGYQTASIAVEGNAQAYSVKVPMSGYTFVVPVARLRQFLKDAGLDGMGQGPADSAERTK